ncbi:hypothetical protein [Aliiglaciecola litoralis]|uniref:Poly(Hydroxyalkanoate) granule-associated protein n=1 Tax=Aliiglaciecola litoralis TaxID=582857 RepID=A0ABN1LN76_9ALTE
MKAAKTVEQASRKSWLASVGVCGESVEKSTDALDKFYVDSNALIQDLITRGESVEAQLKAKLNINLKGKAMFEDKIAMLKAKFGLQSDSRDIQLEKLSTKVDNLIEVVAKLAQQKAAEKSTVKPATKTTTAKAPAKSAAKTASASTAKSTAKTPATTKKAATAKAPATPRTRKTAAKKPAANKD